MENVLSVSSGGQCMRRWDLKGATFRRTKYPKELRLGNPRAGSCEPLLEDGDMRRHGQRLIVD
eukprot:gene1119-22713_t